MEVLLSAPAGYYYLGETRKVIYRMQCTGIWHSHQDSKHTGFGHIFRVDILEMVVDRITRITDLESPHRVSYVDRKDWSQDEPRYIMNVLTWYMDESNPQKVRCLRSQIQMRDSD